jgi:hypothetical protein
MQGISLSLFSEHGYRALEVLTRTSMPVRRLTILIVDASAPSELFPAAHRAPAAPRGAPRRRPHAEV